MAFEEGETPPETATPMETEESNGGGGGDDDEPPPLVDGAEEELKGDDGDGDGDDDDDDDVDDDDDDDDDTSNASGRNRCCRSRMRLSRMLTSSSGEKGLGTTTSAPARYPLIRSSVMALAVSKTMGTVRSEAP
mmetsp:Transcript_2672/g.7125  ORF Transcript_2672/g.7125 Transcript_2672/m.7125 type:complete len:134 (+) Transcript_2672:368-769(+)